MEGIKAKRKKKLKKKHYLNDYQYLIIHDSRQTNILKEISGSLLYAGPCICASPGCCCAAAWP